MGASNDSGRECFTGNIVKQPQRKSGLCACGRAEKRPGQGNCHECHKAANATYRARRKMKMAALERANFAREMSEIAKRMKRAA